MQKLSGTDLPAPKVDSGKSDWMPGRRTALLVGATAGRILREPGFTGDVIAVGSKAAFVISSNSRVVAFSNPDQQPHPRAVLSTLDLGALSVGMPVRVQGEEVLFGGKEILSLEATRCWQRLPVGPGQGVSLVDASRGFGRVLNAALAMHEGDNLGSALPAIEAGSASVGSNRLPPNASPLIAAAMEHVRRIVPVCRSGRLDLAMTYAEDLIGLGPGLTPSGDDFVGGLLFAAYHLNEAFPGEFVWDGEAVGALISRSRSMTHPISHALLSDHAQGQSYEAIHDLMDGMLTGHGELDAVALVTGVTSIGSSSGWDMLAGLLTAMLLVTRGIEPQEGL
jgi:hypothetical protein